MSGTKRQAPVLAVINMKGGVGKTTLSGNLCREIFREHSAKTLLVDFDPQINLSQLLLTRTQYDDLHKQGKTLWSIMESRAPESVFAVAESDLHDIGKVEDYTTRLKYLTKTPDIDLHLLPGDFRLAILNLRENANSLKLARKRFENLITKARETFSLVVLDCNPSSSFLTRCAIESATHLLVPIRPDKYSVLGLEMLSEYVGQMTQLTKKPEFIVVFNGVGRTASSVETELRAHGAFGPSVMVTSIPRSNVLHARADYTGFAVDRKVAYTGVIRTVLKSGAGELAKKLHLKK